MLLDERNVRTRHVIGMLDKLPLSGSSVTDTRLLLEKTTSALTTAFVEDHAKHEATRVASARVRDATTVTFAECRRARAALAAKDAGLGEALPASMLGRSARAVLARADYLLRLGTEASVALGSLALDRDRLADAAAGFKAARAEQKRARAAREGVEETWDAAYASLHGAVESVLALRGLRGRKLQEELQVYFPPRVDSSPQGVPAADQGAKDAETPSSKKPAA